MFLKSTHLINRFSREALRFCKLLRHVYNKKLNLFVSLNKIMYKSPIALSNTALSSFVCPLVSSFPSIPFRTSGMYLSEVSRESSSEIITSSYLERNFYQRSQLNVRNTYTMGLIFLQESGKIWARAITKVSARSIMDTMVLMPVRPPS